MNTIISLLNQSGASAMHFAGGMLWQASLVIGIVFLLDLLLQNRARAALRYALWLLVLVKLVLPPSLALPTGISRWLPVKEVDVPHLAQPPVMTLVASMGPKISSGTETASSPSQSLTVRRDGLLLMAWLGGCVGFLWVVVSRSRRLALLVKGAAPAAIEIQLLAEACARELELARSVALRVSEGIDSPAVGGFRNSTVLLPRGLVGRLSREQMRAVLLHELLHVKRHDVLMNCVQALLQIVYWWHPLVWIANARIRRAREEAVDEGVMVVLGNQCEVYPMTLLEVAKVALRKPFSALGLVGILETRSALNQRVRRLLDRPVPRSAKLNRAGAAGVAMVGAIILPLAQTTPSGAAVGAANEVSTPASETNQGRTVMVEAKIFALPKIAARIDSERVFRAQEVYADRGSTGKALLDEVGLEAVLRYYSSLGIEPLASPRVGVFAGQEAVMQVSKTNIEDGRVIQSGLSIRVTPEHLRTPFHLALQLTLGRLTDPLMTHSERPPSDMFDASNTFVVSTNLSIPEGMTAILGDPLSDPTARTNYLVLITASYLDSEEPNSSPLIGGRSSPPEQPLRSGPIIEGHNRDGSWAIAHADYMEYSPDTRILRARGNVVVNSGVGRVTAEELTLTLVSGAPEIMGIEVVCSGPQPVDRRRALETLIRGLLRHQLQESDRFSHAAVETSLRRIEATGQFQDARVRPRIESNGESTGVILKFEAICWPTLSKIEFNGNTLFDDTTLAKAISSTVGELFDPWKLWTDTDLIRTKYAEAGRTNTEVKLSWSEVDLESNSSVAFEIIEAQ